LPRPVFLRFPHCHSFFLLVFRMKTFLVCFCRKAVDLHFTVE
jgi:hypothetical protein